MDRELNVTGYSKFVNYILGFAGYGIMLATFYDLSRFLYQSEAELEQLPYIQQHYSDGMKNAALLLLFVCQHTLMASDAMKKWWKKTTQYHLERTIYVLCTCVCLEFVMANWKHYRVIIWQIDSSYHNLLLFFYIFGWICIVLQSILMDNLELTGIKQIVYRLRGLKEPMTSKNIEAQQLYKHMRHPIMVAFLAVMWITPIMTLDRAIFAVAMTLYQLLANSISQEDIDYVEDTLWSSFQSLKSSKPKLG